MLKGFQYIDVSYLVEMSDNNIDFITEVISVFKEQVEELHSNMINYLLNEDYKELKSIFHKAKSAMSVMGINEMVVLLGKFENKDISNKDYYDLKKIIDSFGLISENAKKELDLFVKEF